MSDFYFNSENQKKDYENAIREIKNALTEPAEGFIPAEILNYREINTRTIPFRVFVSDVDFVSICMIAEKYMDTLAPFSVTKKEYKTEEIGVYFGL